MIENVKSQETGTTNSLVHKCHKLGINVNVQNKISVKINRD